MAVAADTRLDDLADRVAGHVGDVADLLADVAALTEAVAMLDAVLTRNTEWWAGALVQG